MHEQALGHDDEHIIRQVCDGDVDRYEELVVRYRPYVFAIVLARVSAGAAEEVAQDIFLRAYRSLSNYEPRKPFRRWLSRVAVHTCQDYWRKSGRSREVAVSGLSDEASRWLDGAATDRAREVYDQTEEQGQAREVLEQALATLEPDDRAVLTLVHLDGYTVEEAAEMLGWSGAKVRVRTHRARKKLRAWIGRQMDEER